MYKNTLNFHGQLTPIKFLPTEKLELFFKTIF